jgi:hypothetical protein
MRVVKLCILLLAMALAYAGSLLRGVPGDRAKEGTFNDAWNTVTRLADVGDEILDVL